jgi:hypothetical protein
MTMRKIVIVTALLALMGCSHLAANLQAISDAIAAGERDIAKLCAGMPVYAMTAQTLACAAKATGKTQAKIASVIAAAQAICAGTAAPPSVTSAVAQIGAAADAAANAVAAGCSL